ncbi:MAG: methionyl-tRNA formyltransferase [Alphaproteobacteria bacterium]
MKPLRIGFMGTPDFAVAPLRALFEAGHEISCVYTQPPRPKGRGQKIRNSPVHEYGLFKNIPVFHPASLKNSEEHEIFANHRLDVAIVAAYGLILPKTILSAPVYGCINIHASLLPRWRGASPIQRAIWGGDTETGVTLMQMDEGLDTGAMIMKRAIPITDQTTTPVLHDELAVLGAGMIVEAMQMLATDGPLKSTLQNDKDVIYAKLLDKKDGRVDWSQSAIEVDRQVRALNPWPGVWSEIRGKRFKILAARPQISQSENPGMILNAQGDVSCGGGTLRLMTIQPDNAKAMDFAAAVNGGYIKTGESFQ